MQRAYSLRHPCGEICLRVQAQDGWPGAADAHGRRAAGERKRAHRRIFGNQFLPLGLMQAIVQRNGKQPAVACFQRAQRGCGAGYVEHRVGKGHALRQHDAGTMGG